MVRKADVSYNLACTITALGQGLLEWGLGLLSGFGKL